MSRVAPALIQEIIRKIDLAGVLSQHLRLRQQGRKMLGLCPFHPEKTPSFSFDPETGLFYCFGCKAGGDFIKLMMHLEGWTFMEAVRDLGRRVGIEVEEMSTEERAQYDRKQRIREVLERASTLYHRILTQSPRAQAARDYARGRGLTDDTIARFELGYAPPGPAFLVDWLQERGFTADEVVASGLAVERGGRPVDLLRDRVTFPIHDAHGQRIAMGGRLMGDGQPKYLNSPETALFSKRAHLYGLYQARTHVRDGAAIVVEGYMDVIAMHQGGFPQAVASLGTALTPEQAKLLRRYCESCILAYDADNAGENAADKGIEVFEQAQLAVRVMRMPKGDDPDSLLRTAGADAVRQRLDEAMGIVEYRMQLLAERADLKTPEGKSRFLREMIPTLGKIRDVVRLDEYIRQICHRADVSETAVRRLLRIEAPQTGHVPIAVEPRRDGPSNRGKDGWRGEGSYRGRDDSGFRGRARDGGDRRFTPSAPPPPLAPPGRAASAGLARAESDLLRYLLAQPAAIAEARETITPDDLEDSVARSLLMHLYALPEPENPLRPADLVPLLEHDTGLNQEGVDRRLSEIVLAKNAEPLTPELFAHTLLYFRTRREKAELQALRRSIKQRIGSNIGHDDPDYVRLRELEQRLQNGQTKGT